MNVYPLIGKLGLGQGSREILDQFQKERIEFDIIHTGNGVFQNFMDHASSPPAEDKDLFGFFMENHREMDEIFDGSNVRNWRREGGNAVREKSKLFAPLGDGDIPVDGVFVVDDI
jgi:hypothetical protein